MIPAASPPRRPRGPVQTVNDPQRNAFPGIYDNPRGIAEDAAYNVAPEDVAMKRLFGVTRAELYERSAGRKGSAAPNFVTETSRSRGSNAATNIMTKANAQRLQDVLHEAGKHDGIKHGMDAWYNLDPAYERLKELVGPDDAKGHFTRLNTIIGMMSPGSEVKTEIARGIAAHTLDKQGKIGKFYSHADGRGDPRIPGHPYHSTSHVLPLKKFIEHGKIMSDAPKVPLYVQASEAHETGNQTSLPVPDAHFTRALGMADTRTSTASVAHSMRAPEYKPTGPWFRDKVAAKIGLEAVPAQARLWGTMAQHTGVTTPIGAPKLEILAGHIMRVAKHHQITPESARDLVLTGKIYFRGGAVSRATGGSVNQKKYSIIVPTLARNGSQNFNTLSHIHANSDDEALDELDRHKKLSTGMSWQVKQSKLISGDLNYSKVAKLYDGDREVTRPVSRATGGRVEPTDAQKEAGNYRKDHITLQGLPISIENRKGSTRSGCSKSGRRWAVVMPYDYGYIKRTEGADGDHVDVCIGPDHKSTSVFIIDQMEGSKFDEHKCMLGFNSLAEAKHCYLKGFSDGKDRSGNISRLTMEEFKVWLKHLDTKKPTSNIDRALEKTSVYASQNRS